MCGPTPAAAGSEAAKIGFPGQSLNSASPEAAQQAQTGDVIVKVTASKGPSRKRPDRDSSQPASESEQSESCTPQSVS
jgi:hypothetical protein